jgi:hypothetical protein
VSFADC